MPPEWFSEKRGHIASVIGSLPEERARYTSIETPDKGICGKFSIESLPEGVAAKSITEALDAVEEYFEFPDSRQSAANMLRFNSGSLLVIPDNATVKGPVVQSISLHGSGAAVTRNIIIAGKNSEAEIIQKVLGSGGCQNDLTILVLSEGSRLAFTSLVDSPGSQLYLKKQAFCMPASSLDMRNAVLDCGKACLKTAISLKGEGAEAASSEIYFGTGKQGIDSLSLISHEARRTKSRSDVRAVLRGEAKLAPHGNVKIEKQAASSDAFLNEHILLMDKGAEADPVPALEIQTNDVKAGHSASVSSIDEEQVFYLLCRGFEEKDARRLIALGFLEAAFRGNEKLKQLVMPEIEKKW